MPPVGRRRTLAQVDGTASGGAVLEDRHELIDRSSSPLGSPLARPNADRARDHTGLDLRHMVSSFDVLGFVSRHPSSQHQEPDQETIHETAAEPVARGQARRLHPSLNAASTAESSATSLAPVALPPVALDKLPDPPPVLTPSNQASLKVCHRFWSRESGTMAAPSGSCTPLDADLCWSLQPVFSPQIRNNVVVVVSRVPKRAHQREETSHGSDDCSRRVYRGSVGGRCR